MNNRYLIIFILFIAAHTTLAQEGDPIEPGEEVEEVVYEKVLDTTQINETELPDDLKKVPRNFLLGVKINALPKGAAGSDKETTASQSKTPTNKNTYNFLYYLFYKYKKIDNQID